MNNWGGKLLCRCETLVNYGGDWFMLRLVRSIQGGVAGAWEASAKKCQDILPIYRNLSTQLQITLLGECKKETRMQEDFVQRYLQNVD